MTTPGGWSGRPGSGHSDIPLGRRSLPTKPTVPLRRGLRARIVNGVMSLIEQIIRKLTLS